MAVFVDLNIRQTSDKNLLRKTIEIAAHLGYSTIAVNYVIEFQDKKQNFIKPIPVNDLFNSLPIVQGKSKPIRVLNRLTVVVSDAVQCIELRATSPHIRLYDIVAVLPKTEKLFHTACMTLDVDIICITVTEKQPFHFRRPPVSGAIERGIFFEIIYSHATKDSTMRRYTISNSLSLMQICKGKNVVLSSGAEKPLELRGPYDIANLGLLFGLSEGDAKAAVSTNCRAVILHGETRKTAMGVVYTMKKNQTLLDKEEDEVTHPLSKRMKT
ncbi:ribonuclease P protein subunit p30 [Erpetoichthys calabaricus]|uniref:Ribonuclease P protein subunit p30 n=1 Tax=Erpetoichthys calabaricus TaxID=27687 RepID=A0A8C4RMR9_ERPCA|nr:ribonuclease P protein subunit p30 [Erpetoichthys calabaricus]